MTKMQGWRGSGDAATNVVATAPNRRVNPAVLATASAGAGAAEEKPGTSRAISTATCSGTLSAIAGRRRRICMSRSVRTVNGRFASPWWARTTYVGVSRSRRSRG